MREPFKPLTCLHVNNVLHFTKSLLSREQRTTSYVIGANALMPMRRPLTLGSRLLRRERREKAFGHRNPDPYSSSYFPGQSSCLQQQDLGTCQTLLHGKCSCIFRKLSSTHRLSEVFPEDPAKASSLTVCMFLSVSVPLVPLHVSSTQSRSLFGSLLCSKQLLTWKPPGNPTERLEEWKQRAGSEGETVQHQTIEKGRN